MGAQRAKRGALVRGCQWIATTTGYEPVCDLRTNVFPCSLRRNSPFHRRKGAMGLRGPRRTGTPAFSSAKRSTDHGARAISGFPRTEYLSKPVAGQEGRRPLRQQWLRSHASQRSRDFGERFLLRAVDRPSSGEARRGAWTMRSWCIPSGCMRPRMA